MGFGSLYNVTVVSILSRASGSVLWLWIVSVQQPKKLPLLGAMRGVSVGPVAAVIRPA